MKNRILLIEDDDVSYLLVQEYLEQLNLRLLHKSLASSGLKAFKEYADEIELVLLDIRLPDGNGTSLVHEIRNIKPEIPVIAFTALDSEVRAKCLKSGFNAVLVKPLDFIELKQLIIKYINLKPL